MDVLYFNGIPFLHMMDKKLKWSEVGILKDRTMNSQLSVLKDRWLYRYETPSIAQVDPEFDTAAMKECCMQNGIDLVVTAVKDHGQQGTIEVGNKIIKNLFSRIISGHHDLDIADAVS